MIELGYEGLVAKDEASVHEGGLTRRWLKVKQKDWTVEEDRWRRRISATSQPGLEYARKRLLVIIRRIEGTG